MGNVVTDYRVIITVIVNHPLFRRKIYSHLNMHSLIFETSIRLLVPNVRHIILYGLHQPLVLSLYITRTYTFAPMAEMCVLIVSSHVSPLLYCSHWGPNALQISLTVPELALYLQK